MFSTANPIGAPFTGALPGTFNNTQFIGESLFPESGCICANTSRTGQCTRCKPDGRCCGRGGTSCLGTYQRHNYFAVSSMTCFCQSGSVFCYGISQIYHNVNGEIRRYDLNQFGPNNQYRAYNVVCGLYPSYAYYLALDHQTCDTIRHEVRPTAWLTKSSDLIMSIGMRHNTSPPGACWPFANITKRCVYCVCGVFAGCGYCSGLCNINCQCSQLPIAHKMQDKNNRCYTVMCKPTEDGGGDTGSLCTFHSRYLPTVYIMENFDWEDPKVGSYPTWQLNATSGTASGRDDAHFYVDLDERKVYYLQSVYNCCTCFGMRTFDLNTCSVVCSRWTCPNQMCGISIVNASKATFNSAMSRIQMDGCFNCSDGFKISFVNKDFTCAGTICVTPPSVGSCTRVEYNRSKWAHNFLVDCLGYTYAMFAITYCDSCPAIVNNAGVVQYDILKIGKNLNCIVCGVRISAYTANGCGTAFGFCRSAQSTMGMVMDSFTRSLSVIIPAVTLSNYCCTFVDESQDQAAYRFCIPLTFTNIPTIIWNCSVCIQPFVSGYSFCSTICTITPLCNNTGFSACLRTCGNFTSCICSIVSCVLTPVAPPYQCYQSLSSSKVNPTGFQRLIIK